MATRQRRPSPRRVIPSSPSHFVHAVSDVKTQPLRGHVSSNRKVAGPHTPVSRSGSSSAKLGSGRFSPLTASSTTVRSRLFPPGGRKSPKRLSPRYRFSPRHQDRDVVDPLGPELPKAASPLGSAQPPLHDDDEGDDSFIGQRRHGGQRPRALDRNWMLPSAINRSPIPTPGTAARAQDAHARLALWQQAQSTAPTFAMPPNSTSTSNYVQPERDQLTPHPRHDPVDGDAGAATATTHTAAQSESPGTRAERIPDNSLSSLRRQFVQQLREERKTVVDAIQSQHKHESQNVRDLRTSLLDISDAMQALAGLQASVISVLHEEEKDADSFRQSGHDSSSINLSSLLRSSRHDRSTLDDTHVSLRSGFGADPGVDSDDSLEQEILNISLGRSGSVRGSGSSPDGWRAMLADQDYSELRTIAACQAASASLRNRCQLVAKQLGPVLESFVVHRRSVTRQLKSLQVQERDLEAEREALAAARADLNEAASAVHEQREVESKAIEEEAKSARDRLRQEKEDAQNSISSLEHALQRQFEQQQEVAAAHQQQAHMLAAEAADVQRREEQIQTQEMGVARQVTELQLQRSILQRETADLQAQWSQTKQVTQIRGAEMDQELKSLAQRQSSLDGQQEMLAQERKALEARMKVLENGDAALRLREQALEAMRHQEHAELQKARQHAEAQLHDALNKAQGIQNRAAEDVREAQVARELAVQACQRELAEQRAQTTQLTAQLQAEVAAAMTEAQSQGRRKDEEIMALERDLQLQAQRSAHIFGAQAESSQHAASQRIAELQQQHVEEMAALRSQLRSAKAAANEQAELLMAAQQSTIQLQTEFRNLAIEDDSLDADNNITAAFIGSVDSLRESTIDIASSSNPLLQSARAFEGSLLGLAAVAGKSVAATKQKQEEARKLQQRLAQQNAQLQSITEDEMRRTNALNSELNSELRQLKADRERVHSEYEEKLLEVQRKSEAEVQKQLKIQQHAAKIHEDRWQRQISALEQSLRTEWQRELDNESRLARQLQSRVEHVESQNDSLAEEAETRLAESTALGDELSASQTQLIQAKLAQAEAASEQREMAALAKQELEFQAKLLSRDKESLQVCRVRITELCQDAERPSCYPFSCCVCCYEGGCRRC